MPPAKSLPPNVSEDKSVVPPAPFKAPVAPPVTIKDTPAKSDKKLAD